MLVHAPILHAALPGAIDHDLALLRPAEADEPAEEVEVRLHQEAVHVVVGVLGQQLFQPIAQRLGEALVRVQTQNPLRLNMGVLHAPVELPGVILEGMLQYLRAQRARQRHGAVGGAAVHHHAALREFFHGAQAVAQILFLVLGQDNRRHIGHGRFLPAALSALSIAHPAAKHNRRFSPGRA